MLPRPVGSGIFEPRVIRSPGVSRGSCVDIALLPSATGNQRVSTSNTQSAIPISQRAESFTSSQLSSHQPVGPLPSVPFQRPAYLEHSSLKHLLQTEFPPLLPLGRYGNDISALDDDQNSRNATLSFPRRRRTPLIESDDEDPFTPPREFPPSISAYPPGSIALSPVLRLPTRWSDQDRHLSLSVSSDGRELTFVGKPRAYPSVIANCRIQVCHVLATKMQQPLAQTIPFHLHVEFTTTKLKL
jgi:Ran-binding protein 9/10